MQTIIACVVHTPSTYMRLVDSVSQPVQHVQVLLAAADHSLHVAQRRLHGTATGRQQLETLSAGGEQ